MNTRGPCACSVATACKARHHPAGKLKRPILLRSAAHVRRCNGNMLERRCPAFACFFHHKRLQAVEAYVKSIQAACLAMY